MAATNKTNNPTMYFVLLCQPDNSERITHIGIGLGPEKGNNDILPFKVRVLPTGKEGNMVFGRTLRFGEEDSGEAIIVEDGGTLVFPPKSMALDISAVDQQNKSERHGYGDDSYRSISPTLYLWQFIHSIKGKEHHALLNLLLSTARRLDVAYDLYEKSYSYLHDAEADAPSIEVLSRQIKALGIAESLIILLYRCAIMLNTLYNEFQEKEIDRELAIPKGFSEITSRLKTFRDSFEHIDDRYRGKSRHSKQDPKTAYSIFMQNEFFSSGILRYGRHKLDMANDVLQLLLKTRNNLLLLGSRLMGCEMIYEGEISFSL